MVNNVLRYSHCRFLLVTWLLLLYSVPINSNYTLIPSISTQQTATSIARETHCPSASRVCDPGVRGDVDEPRLRIVTPKPRGSTSSLFAIGPSITTSETSTRGRKPSPKPAAVVATGSSLRPLLALASCRASASDCCRELLNLPTTYIPVAFKSTLGTNAQSNSYSQHKHNRSHGQLCATDTSDTRYESRQVQYAVQPSIPSATTSRSNTIIESNHCHVLLNHHPTPDIAFKFLAGDSLNPASNLIAKVKFTTESSRAESKVSALKLINLYSTTPVDLVQSKPVIAVLSPYQAVDSLHTVNSYRVIESLIPSTTSVESNSICRRVVESLNPILDPSPLPYRSAASEASKLSIKNPASNIHTSRSQLQSQIQIQVLLLLLPSQGSIH